ncbi:pantothenate synthetase [Pilobolus umbonatus]|nr:pantothenate synthetase [Pilobolus umbonatus]
MNPIKCPPGIKVFHKIADFRAWRRGILLENKTLGYVPTMGALHQGHLKLVSTAKKHCDHVALTVFVNPAQFAPTEDLGTYPRTLQSDLDKLAGLGLGMTSAVLVPQVEEVYPSGITLDVNKQKGTFVEVLGISNQLEGASRPNFFRGVATVVTKFLNIVQPEHVFFGQKDIQQCFVIRDMIKDLHIPTQMHICSTVREADGLAMSSRNVYLTPSQRKYSLVLYQTLQTMKKSFDEGVRDVDVLMETGKDLILNVTEQVATKEDWALELDYLAINSTEDLFPLREGRVPDEGCVISLAVRVGKTRLIDNMCLGMTVEE